MTHDEQEEVRRVLASVPPPEMPPEVAARLDARLADLVAERSVPAPEKPGRRRWPVLLVAAAFVMIAGVGLANVLDGTGGLDAATESAGGQAESRTYAEGGAQQDEGEAAQAPLAGSTAPERFLLTSERIRLSSTSLRDDVAAVVDLHIPRIAAEEQANPQSDAEDGKRSEASALFAPCAVPATRHGDRLVAVRLDGRPATLVLREPRDGTREAQVYSCDEASRLLASTRVSAR